MAAQEMLVRRDFFKSAARGCFKKVTSGDAILALQSNNKGEIHREWPTHTTQKHSRDQTTNDPQNAAETGATTRHAKQSPRPAKNDPQKHCQGKAAHAT